MPSSSQATYTWHDVYRMALRHRPTLIKANIIAFLAAFAAVPIPLLMPLMVDEVLLEKPATLVGLMNSISPASWHGPILYMGIILFATVGLRLAHLFLSIYQTRQFTIIAKDITYNMRKSLLGKLNTLSMSAYETIGGGTVSSHLVVDVETIDQFIGQTVAKFVIALLSLVGISIVLLWLNWQLAIFLLLLNPFVIFLTTKLGKHVKKLKQNENSAFEAFQQALTETLDGIQQIRTSNREKHYLNHLGDLAKDVRNHGARFFWRSDAANRFSFMVFLAGFDVFRAISFLMVVFSDLSIGQMFAVFGYLWFMMGPVQEVLGIQYAWYGAKAALNRVNELFDQDSEPQYPSIHDPFKNTDTVGVALKDIHFSYKDGPEVLRGINLSIKPGEKVAFVGSSGGGKSTLVQVMLGLYPQSRGEVLYDGLPMSEIGLSTVRENVATVLQHPVLFNATVRDNLSLGQALTDDQLWHALDVAQLKTTIKALDQGLDTVVGRQGVRLSGGQRQRLAIARMVLSDPKVVILDEATSALDTTTEANLHEALQAFLQGRTTLIIAHRLSAVKQADRVYVFDDGHIIESGEHQELIEHQGVYARLYG